MINPESILLWSKFSGLPVDDDNELRALLSGFGAIDCRGNESPEQEIYEIRVRAGGPPGPVSGTSADFPLHTTVRS